MGAEVRFLICTDVAARGIDIAGLPFVIQRLGRSAGGMGMGQSGQEADINNAPSVALK